MIMTVWILPIVGICLLLLRYRFPEFKKSAKSGWLFFLLATLTQFQNCGNVEPGDPTIRAAMTSYPNVCTGRATQDDPACQRAPIEACAEDDLDCTNDTPMSQNLIMDRNCIPTGWIMPAAQTRAVGYIPPCDSRARYCMINGRALSVEDCR